MHSSRMGRSRWRARSVRVLHSGVLRVEEHDIETDDGRRFRMPVIHAPDCAVVCAIDDDGQVVLARQHRYVLDRETLELPGGMIDPGETPAQAARRELLEETGMRAGTLTALGVYPTGGISTERMHMFMAVGCRPDPDVPPDSDCVGVRMPLRDALAVAQNDSGPVEVALGLMLTAARLGLDAQSQQSHVLEAEPRTPRAASAQDLGASGHQSKPRDVRRGQRPR